MLLADNSSINNIAAGYQKTDTRHCVVAEDTDTRELAAIVFRRGYDIDAFLKNICKTMTGAGVKVGGLIQETSGGVGGCAQSVHVVDIRSGKKFDIWDDRGSCARGCRLNEGALDVSAEIVSIAIQDKVDLLIINRFGRAESLGRGLLGSFVAALESGLPILTSVREPYVQAWQDFHGGLGMELKADQQPVLDWASATLETVPPVDQIFRRCRA